MCKLILKKVILVIALWVAGYAAYTQGNADIRKAALQSVCSVADKLIRDTRFSFKMVPQKEELGLQVIDFRKQITQKNQLAYATRTFSVTTDTLVRFGINCAGNVSVWVNGQEVYRQDIAQLIVPVEEAYDRFRFNKFFTVKLFKGRNEMLIRYLSKPAEPVVFLRPTQENGDVDRSLTFDSTLKASWLFLGAFAGNDMRVIDPGAPLKTYYNRNGKMYTWEKAPQRMLPELLIDSTLTYQRDPYADWNYSNGNTVWSLVPLAKETGEGRYLSYVKKYTGFLIENKNYFQKQYDSLFIFRGSFHRLFRLSMLDDAGSAILPFVELNLVKTDPALQKLIDPVADYIVNRQVRLPDGTYCRPEPTKFTVWADDLFMSVPFLLRLAKSTGKEKYYDSAAQQFMRFRKYLLNTDNRLYQHGWFSHTKKQAPVAWGRANGWIAWATAELLSWLPHNHEMYAQILASFKEQVATLATYQATDGLWHQVLTNTDSYKETSCTAMFTLVMARGVTEGWIDQKYRAYALKGWAAVQKKIEKDGTVHGICRGTEIGFDEKFYFERKTFDQDPRGLGAVITAGIEIAKMER